MRARNDDAVASSGGDPLRLRLMLGVSVLGLSATAALLSLPSFPFEFRSPQFHVALETAAALTAALVAYLFFGRLREHASPSNWALAYALLLSALVNFGLAVVPSAVPGAARFAIWAPLLGRVVAAGALAYAAWAPVVAATSRKHVGWSILGAAVATASMLGIATWLLTPWLPAAVARLPGGVWSDFATHPLIAALHGVSLLLFLVASLGFVRRSESTGDELMRWLAAGALLAAFARLHYLLSPSLQANRVYTGDLLRLGYYALLLAGAMGEIRRFWQGLAHAAALDERRRIARDLHDGLAQELAYISSQTRWLRLHEGGGVTARALEAAADRALDESRRAITALTRDDDEPLDVALAQAAEEVADRVGTAVRLDLEPGAEVDATTREGLIRIAREAIANAGRHSQADHVHVQLSRNGQVRLRVADQGVGFDIDAVGPERFGLVSMRERAQALNAEFFVTSSPGHGTSVEVALL